MLGQVKINKNINKKLLANDKSLESLNVKLQTLSSTLKNQLSFNKMIETQLAQIAASIPPLKMGRSQGNLRLPLKMSTWCSPDGVTRLGDHHALTMQVSAIPQRTMPGIRVENCRDKSRSVLLRFLHFIGPFSYFRTNLESI